MFVRLKMDPNRSIILHNKKYKNDSKINIHDETILLLKNNYSDININYDNIILQNNTIITNNNNLLNKNYFVSM